MQAFKLELLGCFFFVVVVAVLCLPVVMPRRMTLKSEVIFSVPQNSK